MGHYQQICFQVDEVNFLAIPALCILRSVKPSFFLTPISEVAMPLPIGVDCGVSDNGLYQITYGSVAAGLALTYTLGSSIKMAASLSLVLLRSHYLGALCLYILVVRLRDLCRLFRC